mgnify:CR=1 FL=1
MDKYFKIYKNKKVLITGHTGFKGSWLSLWLKELGAKVIGYSLEPPTEPNLFEAIDLGSKIIHIIGDVRDKEYLTYILRKYQPQFVFHLAAQSLVRYSYEKPKLTYETNIMGTVNILEAVREVKGVEVCIIATSDKCYQNKEWIYGYRESDPLGGYDPYSSSKACAEIVSEAYRRSFFTSKKQKRVALSSVRAGNVIGGGDWGKDRLIPDCVRALSQNKKIVIRNPHAIRPWQYILEPLAGYLLLGGLMYKDKERYSSAWNFGPLLKNTITVEELTQLSINYWGKGEYMIDKRVHPYEANYLRLDVSKAYALLGWRAIYDINKTVKKTVEWYKKFYKNIGKEKLYKFTVKEIREYISDLTRYSV